MDDDQPKVDGEMGEEAETETPATEESEEV